MNAKSVALKIQLLFSTIRLVPHIFLMKCHPMREFIELDLERWADLKLGKKPDTACGAIYSFIQLMTLYPEYRNVFYHRIGWTGKILHHLCRRMPTLYIYTKDIGPGLFIQHGFATIISAQKIGQN